MELRTQYTVEGVSHVFEMVFVRGTDGQPYDFGENDKRQVEISDFYISKTQVTQALWKQIMNGDDPSHFKGDRLPVENVSYNGITEAGGFLDLINASKLAGDI